MAGYLVTGGCGFIGRHLVASLVADGHAVRVLDNLSTGRRDAIPANVPLIEANAADGRAVERALAGMDGCFHLAGDPSVPRCLADYLGSHLTNQTSTVAVLDAAAKARAQGGQPVPVIYASSCAVYGVPVRLPLAEDGPAYPVSGYGVDKLAGEQHARIAADLFGVPSVGLRYFNIYGPGQPPDSPYAGVLAIFCRRLSAGAPVTVHGDGLQSRDFVFVADAIRRTRRAMALAHEASGPAAARVVNVCTGQPVTLIEAGETIARLLGTTFQPQHGPERPGDVRQSLGDATLCHRLLGDVPTTPLADGLAATLAWMKDVPVPA
jgi:UDP-glucose 4-epimerase